MIRTTRLLAIGLLSTAVATSTVGLAQSHPAAASTSSVAVVGSLIDVRPSDNPVGSTAAALASGRNETQSFQLVVHASGVAVTVTDISAAVPGTTVSVFAERYYRVSVPSDGELGMGMPCTAACDIPDALVPKVDRYFNRVRNGFPATVAPNTSQTFWIDVFVPVAQTPGVYNGSATVSKSDGNIVVPIGLSVNSFVLPATSSLHGAFQTNPNKLCPAHNGCAGIAGGGWALYAKYAQAGLDDRISLSNPAIGNPAGGNLANFRTYAEPLLNGTAPTLLVGAQITDVTLLRYEANAMAAWKTEAASHGFLSKLTFYCDETGQNASNWINFCNGPTATGDDFLTANANWNATVVAPDPGPMPVAKTSNAAEYAWAKAQGFAVANAINTMIPVINDMHAKGSTSQRGAYQPFLDSSSKNRVWMYSGCQSSGCAPVQCTAGPTCVAPLYDAQSLWTGWPSYHIDQRPLEHRAMPWQDFLYNTTGEYYFETVMDLSTAWNPCNAAASNCQFNEGGNGDGTLFYPGTPAMIGGPVGSDIPIESMRLKRMRDGRQDYEYLQYLSQHGHDAQARQIASTLLPSMSQSDGSADQFVAQQQLDAARSALIAFFPATTSGPEIAFTRGTTNSTIWIMNHDGSNQRQITFAPGGDSQPSWSPDGTKIAFVRGTGVNAEIYTVTLATGTEQRLTTNTLWDEKPAWSHDGTTIAFVRHAANGNGQITVMSSTGTNATDVSKNMANNDYDPAWIDASNLAFSSVRGTNVGAGSDVYRMNANGSGGATNLSATNTDDDLPSGSPSGSQIAFDSLRAGEYDIIVANSDGTNPNNVTNASAGHEYDPTFAPTGTSLAFTQGVGSGSQITVLDLTTGTTTSLTNPGQSDREADWLHPCVSCPINTVPSAPRSPSAIAGTGSASLTWLAPVRNGGSTITAYVVTPFDNGIARPARTFAAASTRQIITGLTTGHTYTFRVAAVNAIGRSVRSPLSNAVSVL